MDPPQQQQVLVNHIPVVFLSTSASTTTTPKALDDTTIATTTSQFDTEMMPAFLSTRFNRYNAANLAAYLFNVLITFTAASVLNKPDNATLSRKYQTLVTPAGWAFSIWGVIFLLQLVWAAFPVFDAKKRDTPWVKNAVAFNYVYVCLAQAAWTIAFCYEFMILSAICMYTILYFLCKTVRALLAIAAERKLNLKEYALQVAPFVIHFAWITAASFVNFNVVLVAYNLSATLLFTAAVVSLILLFGVALYYMVQDSLISAVLVWPLLGIYSELSNSGEAGSGGVVEATYSVEQIDFISYAAMVGAVVLTVIVAMRRILVVFGNGGRGSSADDGTEEAAYLRSEDK